jgi:hypothetical protein
LNIIRNYYYKNDAIVTEAIITEMMNNYINESSGFTLFISMEIEDKIKDILVEIQDADVNNLKGIEINAYKYVILINLGGNLRGY